MIKAQELRIGNWLVDCNSSLPKSFKVTGYLIQYIEKNGDYGIEPIPLTPEILEGCGFDIALRLDVGFFSFRYYAEVGVTMFVNGHPTVTVKYLHLLQNLYYFFLNQTELTVKLPVTS